MVAEKTTIFAISIVIVRNRIERQRFGRSRSVWAMHADDLRTHEIPFNVACQPCVKRESLRADRPAGKADAGNEDGASARPGRRATQAHLDTDLRTALMQAAGCVPYDRAQRNLDLIDERAARIRTGTTTDRRAAPADLRQRQRRRQAVAKACHTQACIQAANPLPAGTDDPIQQIAPGRLAAGIAGRRACAAKGGVFHKLLLSA